MDSGGDSVTAWHFGLWHFGPGFLASLFFTGSLPVLGEKLSELSEQDLGAGIPRSNPSVGVQQHDQMIDHAAPNLLVTEFIASGNWRLAGVGKIHARLGGWVACQLSTVLVTAAGGRSVLHSQEATSGRIAAKSRCH